MGWSGRPASRKSALIDCNLLIAALLRAPGRHLATEAIPEVVIHVGLVPGARESPVKGARTAGPGATLREQVAKSRSLSAREGVHVGGG
jgi:hypothetical protein